MNESSTMEERSPALPRLSSVTAATSASAPDLDAAFQERIDFFESVLAEWLARDGVTLACGNWSDGGIAEILPAGKAEILPRVYDGCFAGVREIRLSNAGHHVHVDLGRVHQLAYSIAPSVCFAGNPSFELRLLTTGAGGAPTQRWSASLMLACPYVRGALDTDSVRCFLQQACTHVRQRPDLVHIEVHPKVVDAACSNAIRACLSDVLGMSPDASWPALLDLVKRPTPPALSPTPPMLDLLREALALRAASLVLYRERTLVEFQTEKLAGVFRYEEDGHVSWQIGAFEDHHCHLALGAVTEVLFSAEPVPCQQGRLNYTVWFLVSGPCGNPYRSDGYFSVVLNRPYDEHGPRRDVIDAVRHLFLRHRHQPWVRADRAFLDALDLEREHVCLA